MGVSGCIEKCDSASRVSRPVCPHVRHSTVTFGSWRERMVCSSPRQINQVLRARLAAGFAAFRRDAEVAAGRFSAAMLRRSASIKLRTFSAEGFTAACCAGRFACFLRRMRTSARGNDLQAWMG